MKQQFTSKNTSINKNRCPVIYNKENVIPFLVGKKVLDWGGGKYDTGKNRAAEYGCEVSIYDPYNRSEKENTLALHDGPYDVVLSSNVLNVVKEPEVREYLIQEMCIFCKEHGILFFTVYEGDRSGVGKQTGPDQWQENRTIKSYEPEIARALGSHYHGSFCKHGVITVFVN